MKLKKNFIVSNFKEIWIKGFKKIFISDPYVFHCLERADKTKKYDVIDVAGYLRKTKTDLIIDSNYVDEKYLKYVQIISKRLDDIHGKNFGVNFWKKSLSMGFIRSITTFYNSFKIFETYFNSELHDCNVVSTDSYLIPNDFEEYRSFFQNSDFGQEQIFSIYINLFYPTRFNQLHFKNPFKNVKKTTWTQKIRNQDWFYSIKSLYYKIRFGIFQKKIRIGILGSYFSSNNLKTLLNKSDNEIAPLIFPYYFFNNKSVINFTYRKMISKYEDDFDKFDKFFFNSLKYSFPKVFLEDFLSLEKNFEYNINYLKELKYIVSENWISDTQNSIFLALAQEKSIKHISNEHNCFFHPYAGSYINHVIDMADIYTTIGWEDTSMSKVIKSGSLFQFTIDKSNQKYYKILFISGAMAAKATHFSGAYGYCEEKAINSVNFNISFFDNINKSTLKEITYRGYPSKKIKHIQLFDKEYYYQKYLSYFKISFKNDSSKKQMSESNLVIVDYISTAHLESILMDIPTVFFWDRDSYYLNQEFKDFFKPLIEAGICQTNPVEAAALIEKIKDNPKKWWLSEDVQKGKNEFLDKNIGEPKNMINYLLCLLKN